ncbi:hypothetical protein CTO_1023 [Chlamydia trachomatis A2497]|uniref:Uncharacterized protein n=1 Tax=Chlamydia trachomatis serovar A (strain A2497) TaxID=580047 RepID=G4NM17_CHLT4|nr:hypothetical protein CTO_1023 [Chlamydia trachomatis A2497]
MVFSAASEKRWGKVNETAVNPFGDAFVEFCCFWG